MAKTNEQIITETIATLAAVDINGPAKPSTPYVEPVLTAEIVVQVVVDLQEPEANGGYMGIAKKNGISQSQVKQIKRAADERLVALQPVEIV